MSSMDDWDGEKHPSSQLNGYSGHGSIESMLFESLVHHLIEKGLLTKNDALSIVQAIAHVKRGRMPEVDTAEIDPELGFLRRLYNSFEALPERNGVARSNQSNVRELRPPLHGNAPTFPEND